MYFEDVGDSALNFQLESWIELCDVSPAIIDSAVRLRINAALDAVGLVMSFPQRGVHLCQDPPLQVQLTPPRGAVAGQGPWRCDPFAARGPRAWASLG